MYQGGSHENVRTGTTPMRGAIPIPHGAVTDHDGLAMYESSAMLLSQENSSVSLRIYLS